MTALRHAMESSQVVRRLAPYGQWIRETRRRISVGLGEVWSDRQEIHEVERIRVLLSTSRIAAVLSSVVMAPIMASREASVGRMLDPLRSFDLRARIRTASCAIVVAVLTHTALLTLLGIPVHVLGWSMRLGLLAAGTIGLRWPDLLAAAWNDKQSRFP